VARPRQVTWNLEIRVPEVFGTLDPFTLVSRINLCEAFFV